MSPNYTPDHEDVDKLLFVIAQACERMTSYGLTEEARRLFLATSNAFYDGNHTFDIANE